MKIEMHSNDNWRSKNPAINVKVYKLGASVEDVVERFKCTRDDAERALGFAFESQQEQFWGQIEELAQSIFGAGVRTFSEGRSSGWLVVQGLPEVESWNAVVLSKWRKLMRLVGEDIKHRVASDTLMADIESNRWAEPMSEKFNFYDAKGTVVCLAEVNQMVDTYRKDLLAGK